MKIIAAILLIACLLFSAIETVKSAETSRKNTSTASLGAGQTFFRDEKNGYFSMIPPMGWKFSHYDDSRTKVDWRHPTDYNVLIRVIARAATENMAEMLKNTQSTATQYNARGIKTVVTEERVGEHSAIVIDQWLDKGARSRIVLFIAGDVHFNAQYGASSETLFQKHLDEATRALSTLSPLPGRTQSKKVSSQEELAWYKRYSFLLFKIGDVKGGKVLAAEGLAKYPDDKELKQMVNGILPEKEPGAVR